MSKKEIECQFGCRLVFSNDLSYRSHIINTHKKALKKFAAKRGLIGNGDNENMALSDALDLLLGKAFDTSSSAQTCLDSESDCNTQAEAPKAITVEVLDQKATEKASSSSHTITNTPKWLYSTQDEFPDIDKLSDFKCLLGIIPGSRIILKLENPDTISTSSDLYLYVISEGEKGAMQYKTTVPHKKAEEYVQKYKMHP
jgi:hypothetical protein